MRLHPRALRSRASRPRAVPSLAARPATPSALRRLLPLVLVVTLLPALGASSASSATSATSATSARATAAVDEPRIARLVAVRAAAHDGFDRVVWEFDGPLPERTVVQRGPALHADGSGHRIPIAGRSVLTVSILGARAHDEAGTPTGAEHLVPGLPNVVEVVRSGDFEAVVSYGVGIVSDEPHRVFQLANPSRVVLDVETADRQRWARVPFQDRSAYAAGRGTPTVTVLRRVPAAAPATAVLSHLFAGPTAAEQRRGLVAVLSGATGFTGLTIRDGVASVRLVGGCASGGATYTVADLVGPALKQFATVDHVKLYDPQGRTARPTGHSDSRPACLEP